jgi:glycosyltransferase involved in cell wall biosynthesis
MQLTVAILARDNEDEITECLDSVSWADERYVILDTRSSDQTEAIALAKGARVERHLFANFSSQRDYALDTARGDWLFFLDSDERATPELETEIRHVVAECAEVGWWVPRYNHIWGAIIRHGGWYPDYQLRLIKRGHGHYDPMRQVHELVLLDGQEGYLEQPLIHFNYASIRQFIHKQKQYVALEAAIRYQQGVRPKPWTFLSLPVREFYRRYIKLQGYRDGWRGCLLCTLVAYYYGFVVTVLLARKVANKS